MIWTKTNVSGQIVGRAGQSWVCNELVENIHSHDVAGIPGCLKKTPSSVYGSNNLSSAGGALIDLLIADVDCIHSCPVAVEVTDQLSKIASYVADTVNASKQPQAVGGRLLSDHSNVTSDIVGADLGIAALCEKSKVRVDLSRRLALCCSIDHIVADSITTATGRSRRRRRRGGGRRRSCLFAISNSGRRSRRCVSDRSGSR